MSRFSYDRMAHFNVFAEGSIRIYDVDGNSCFSVPLFVSRYFCSKHYPCSRIFSFTTPFYEFPRVYYPLSYPSDSEIA